MAVMEDMLLAATVADYTVLVLSFGDQESEEGAGAALAVPVLRREGGLLLAIPVSVAPGDLRGAGPASGPIFITLRLDEAPAEASRQLAEVRFVDWPEPSQLRGATPRRCARLAASCSPS